MATSDGARKKPVPVPAPNGERGHGAWLALSQVMDDAILDRDGKRAGRVDDLLLRLSTDGPVPRLVLDGIVSGPLPRPAPAWLRHVAKFCYLLCGIRDPHPAVVSWQSVHAIDAFVHVDVDRDEAGLRTVDRSVLRFVSKLPGSSWRRNHD